MTSTAFSNSLEQPRNRDLSAIHRLDSKSKHHTAHVPLALVSEPELVLEDEGGRVVSAVTRKPARGAVMRGHRHAGLRYGRRENMDRA